jgi:hypothetical protein
VQQAAYGGDTTAPPVIPLSEPIQLINIKPPIDNKAMRKTTPGEIPESSLFSTLSTESSMLFCSAIRF